MRKTIAGLCALFPSLILLAIWWRWYWRRIERGEVDFASSVDGCHSNRRRQNSKVEFTIPDAVVGYVIGRKGNRIRKIEEESGAKIRFKERIGTGDKIISITGLAEYVENAESAIRSIVEDKLSQSRQQKESRVLIPEGAVGRLIGRRGTNIRSIQRQSGARISIEEREKGGGNRLCLVTGNTRQIEEALVLIEESIQTGQERGSRASVQRQCEGEQPCTLIPAYLPQTSDYFPVFVSAIDSEGGVWVQPIEQQDPALLESLVQDMTSLYCELSPQEASLECMEVGTVCAAPFEHDGSWYRAIVTSFPTPDSASLLYLDYGDSGSLPRAKLKVLRREFWSLRCQAVRCVLDSIVPSGSEWNEEALTALEYLTHSASWKAVMLRVVLPAQHTVTIVDTNTDQDIDIAKQLVDRGFAEWMGLIAEPHPPFTISHKIREDLQSESDSCCVGYVSLPSGHFPAFVMAVHSINLLYIMPASSLRQLAELTETMSSVYGADHVVNRVSEEAVIMSAETLVVSKLVAVYLGQWYRAAIVDRSPDDPAQVRVQLLDYGVLLLVACGSIRPLKEDFHGPCFAVPCSLADISYSPTKREEKSGGKGEGMGTRLANWTNAGRWENSVIVKATLDKNRWRVTLFVPGESTSANHQLSKREQLDNYRDEDGHRHSNDMTTNQTYTAIINNTLKEMIGAITVYMFSMDAQPLSGCITGWPVA